MACSFVGNCLGHSPQRHRRAHILCRGEWGRQGVGGFQILEDAVAVEARGGFRNAAGAELSFTQFVAREFRSKIREHSWTPAQRTKTERQLEVLSQYDKMSPDARKDFLTLEVLPHIQEVRRSFDGKRLSMKSDQPLSEGRKDLAKLWEMRDKLPSQEYFSYTSPKRSSVVSNPDLSWNAVDKNRLRLHQSYWPLPPASQIELKRVEDLARVRQDSVYWEAARKKTQITASNAWTMLGFGEDMVAKKFKVSKATGMRTHDLAVKAWECASDPSSYEPPPVSEASKVAMAWGRSHEGTAIVTLMEAHLSSSPNPQELLRVFETGLHVLTENAFNELPSNVRRETKFEDVPIMAASPDALMYRRNSVGLWRPCEVLEVKSRCPFIYMKPVRNLSKKFLLRNVEPHKAVAPRHFAQIQIQLLCSGCEVGHLGSYSVSGAMKVYEVQRSDEWLASALHYTSKFNLQFVVAGVEPHENFFCDDEEYIQFVELTERLCADAPCWLSVPDGPLQRGCVSVSPRNPFVPLYSEEVATD